MKKKILILYALFAWAFSSSAFAIPLPKPSAAFGTTGVSTVGNVATITPGVSAARNISVLPTDNADFARILGGSYSHAARDAGAVGTFQSLISGKGYVPMAERSVAVEISSVVKQDAIIGGISGLLAGGVPGAILGAGMPLVLAWIASAGIEKNTDPQTNQTHPFLKQLETAECKATGQALAAISHCESQGYRVVISTRTDACEWIGIDGNGAIGRSCYVGPIVKVVGKVPATWNDVKDKANIVPFPPGALKELLDKGAVIEGEPWKVTGPATVTGQKTETTLADGTKVTTTTDSKYSYDGNKITNTSNETKTVTTKPDGSSSEDKKVETPADNSDKDDGTDAPPTDTSLPEVPDLYERKYPDGMVGVWNTYKDQLKSTSLAKLAAKLMPSIQDGGTCPAWPINLDLAQWATYGTHDVAPPCWIWGVAKAILIVSALLLARALIFGG